MNTASAIQSAIKAKLTPSHVEVIDQSPLHASHAGAKETGGGHFLVTVVASEFEGKNLVNRHRAIYAAVQEQLKEEIHALAIKAFTPKEWQQIEQNSPPMKEADSPGGLINLE